MAVWYRARAELRARRYTWLGLVALIGIVGGIVTALAAGARRTDTAFDRFLARIHQTDVNVSTGANSGFAPLDFRQVAALPQVAEAVREDNPVYVSGHTDSGRPVGADKLVLTASPDPRFGISIDGVKLVSGRPADPARPDEAVIGRLGAEALGLQVGDTLTLAFATPNQLRRLSGSVRPPPPRGPTVRFRVVGVSEEFSLPTGSDLASQVVLTPAFYRRYASRVAISKGMGVRLRNGDADVQPFTRAVDRLAGRESAGVFPSGDYVAKINRTTHVEAFALWVLAALAGLAGALILTQALARQANLEAGAYRSLRAVGMSSRQLIGVSLVRGVALGAAGAVWALAMAYGLSWIAPFGLARRAEPDPGLDFDPLVLLLGAAVLCALVVIVCGATAWRLSRTGPTPRAPARSSPLVRGLARLGLPVAAVVGARLAVERGSGPTAAPVRTAFFGATLAVATVSAMLVFSASLDHLESTPSLYGQNWDAQLGDAVYGGDFGHLVLPVLRRDPDVAAYAAGTSANISLGDETQRVLAFSSVRGSIAPTILAGRAPASPGEVLLASKTMEGLGVGIGDELVARHGSRSERLRVVGRGVIPEIAELRLGHGAYLTLQGLRRIVPDAPRNAFFVRFSPTADPARANERLSSRFGPLPTPVKPQDLANLSRVGGTPFAISALMATLALATLAHVLVVTIRRRRRDFAVLVSLGFVKGQITRAVAWQATTVAAFALPVGIPLGVAAGRWIWRVFADGLGVAPGPVLPIRPLLLIVPVTLVVANAVAAIPGLLAARLQPATALATE